VGRSPWAMVSRGVYLVHPTLHHLGHQLCTFGMEIQPTPWPSAGMLFAAQMVARAATAYRSGPTMANSTPWGSMQCAIQLPPGT
jgi:hypothetical protein